VCQLTCSILHQATITSASRSRDRGGQMSTERHIKDTRLGNDASSITTQNAALQGASLAFGKPPVKPKPKMNTYSGNNGALAAATKVGGGGASRQNERTPIARLEAPGQLQKLGYQSTAGSVGGRSYTGGSERGTVRQRLSNLDSGGFLQAPGAKTQSKSPSFIAAALAASRSASVSPNHTGQHSAVEIQRPTSSFQRRPASVRSSSSRDSSDHALDTRPIPPTTSLIGMFEQNAVASAETLKRPTVPRSVTSTAVRRSPPPKRQQAPLHVRARSQSPLTPKPINPEIKAPKPILLPQIPINLSKHESPMPPPASERRASLPASKPIPIPTKTKPAKIHQNEVDDASSDDSFVSASDNRPSFRAALAYQNRHLTSTSAVSLSSSVTVESMANAIVASSLASSRAASPSKSLQAPPPPPSRRSPRSHHLFHNSKEISRTPSPAKQTTLRQTMRKPKPDVSEDEGEKRRAKKNLMKKHPNKHHEGDRKRWRDEITERERKRYEAVWASNKGLFSAGEVDEFSVCSLVVRDIYSRSRLHLEVLEEVYALVDKQQNGRLEKEEFVVGLWLIDQRLKGRKLPIRVSDSVWRSVGSMNGIMVRKAWK
jgi:hypothetical protein